MSKCAYGERENLEEIPSFDGLQIEKLIGNGHFCKVYKGIYRENPVAIKVFDRVNYRRIAAEIAILTDLSDSKHIIHLVRVFEGKNIAIVLEYVDRISETYFYEHLSTPRIRYILRSLLNTLQNLRDHRILHRDLRFENLLISRHFKDIKMCGFGNGSFLFRHMSPSAGSRCVRAPELLLGYRRYNSQCDTWSLGVFILTTLSEGKNPFIGKTVQETLNHISEYFGASQLVRLIDTYNLKTNGIDLTQFSQNQTKSFDDLFTERMKTIVNKDLIFIMNGFLTIDPEKRLTPEQALKVDFFKKPV